VADEWTHVAAVRSANTVKLLVDHNEDASTSYSSTLHDNDASLIIGANADGSNFDGIIDEVRIATADKSATLGEAEVTYTYNARNQLVTETCGLNVRTYSYDNNGNVTKIEEKVDTTVILTEEMAYDKLNRMLRHEGPSGVEVFAYRGAEWHRFSQATAAGGTSFLYDGDNVVADIASGVDAFYVTPFLDQNLSITTGGSTYYYSQDGLGSVRTLTDSTGTVKNTYDYLPFGGAHQPGTNVTVGQRYTYTGREKNPASDSMYYRYRHYFRGIGRFLGRDPIGRQRFASLYRYARNNPLRYGDPSGLFSLSIGKQVANKYGPDLVGRMGAIIPEIDDHIEPAYRNDAKKAIRGAVHDLKGINDAMVKMGTTIMTAPVSACGGWAATALDAAETGLEVSETAVDQGMLPALTQAAGEIAGQAGSGLAGNVGEGIGTPDDNWGDVGEELGELVDEAITGATKPIEVTTGYIFDYETVGECTAYASVSWFGNDKGGRWTEFYARVICCCDDNPRASCNARGWMSGCYDLTKEKLGSWGHISVDGPPTAMGDPCP
jgi:RHS repeat-associated protein